MKRVHLFAGALVALAALVIGCAGSGSDTPNTTGGGLTDTPRVEAVVAIERSNLKDPSKYTDAQLQDPLQVDPDDLIDPTLYGVADPRNIQTREQYYFQLAWYDAAGSRHIVDNSEVVWSTSTEATYGQIGTNSGLFVASNRVTFNQQFVFATYRGTRYDVLYAIKPRQVRLLGKIVDENTGAAVPGVNLFFYDSFNSVVGEVRSGFDGTIRASVPTNAVRFNPSVDSVPTSYYQTFLYETLRYTIGVASCKAPLPDFTVVGTRILPSNILMRQRQAGVPTPDPTGCTP